MARVANVELPISSFGVSRRVVRTGPENQVWFIRVIAEFDGQVALMRVSNAMVEKCVQFGNCN